MVFCGWTEGLLAECNLGGRLDADGMLAGWQGGGMLAECNLRRSRDVGWMVG